MDQFGSFDKCFECSPGAWNPQSGTNHLGPDPCNLPYPRTSHHIQYKLGKLSNTAPHLTDTHHQIKLLLKQYFYSLMFQLSVEIAISFTISPQMMTYHNRFMICDGVIRMKLCRLSTFFDWPDTESIHHLMSDKDYYKETPICIHDESVQHAISIYSG